MTIGEGVENYLNQRLEESEGLLVGLNTGGCTGFTVSLMKQPLSDIISQNTKVCTKVFVEPESTGILSKCSLTLSEDAFSEKLTVVVPKETFVSCGCNESFAPRDILDY